MPQFDPNFVAAYLADNESSDSKNMTEFEKADGFEQISEKNMANYEDQSTEKNLASFEAAAEEWDAVAEVEATFGEGKKEKVAVVAAPIVTMEKVLDHLQEAWIEDYLAQVRPIRPNQGAAARLLACLPQKVGSCLPFASHPLPTALTQVI